MCGIVGVVGDVGKVSSSDLERVRDVMVHRGPDDVGLDTVGEARFGFRRLSIIDLSAAGHQPMIDDSGQVMLVFNGEIYNYLSLRDRLTSRRSFKSATDSEVLLNGYLEWGWERLLKSIDGMFGFAIYDARIRKLHVARDRVGKKPLFYRKEASGLAFASTLNALRDLFPGSLDVDPEALDAYLTYQAVPAPLSLLKGFKQLPPAHSLVFDLENRKATVERYWSVDYTPKHNRSEDEILSDLDDLVHAAVRKRFMSDVPLGAFLSGGVDSSLVVSVMSKETTEPVEAVVMGFEDPKFDERPFARLVAEDCGARLHEHILKPNAIADLPEIVWHYGQPVADVSIVPTYYVAAAAAEHVTVIINGDGGDEVFGGYARPMVARAAQHYRRMTPSFVRSFLSNAPFPQGNKVLKRIGMLAAAGGTSAEDAFVYNRAFRNYRSEAYGQALGSSQNGHNADIHYRRVWEGVDSTDDVDRALYGDFATYLPDQLLAKMDVSTMAHSLEGRSPLLDTALIEYAARIPTSLRLKRYRTKYLLKKLAERYVRPEVLYRRKRGFVMPASDWLRGELAPFVRAALTSEAFRERNWIRESFVTRILGEHMADRNDWGEQLWTLFVLEVWARMTLDGTLQRGDSLEALL